MTTLSLDLSDSHISIALGEDRYISEIKSQEFWDNTEPTLKLVKDFLATKNIRNFAELTVVLPVKALNFQIVTLPEKIKEREKKVLLGLELDKGKFSTNFNYKKLDVTVREEDGVSLCDYIVLGAKRGAYERLQLLAKSLAVKRLRGVPSFMLFAPRAAERLSATAYVGEDRTEISLWGSGYPLAIAAIPNTGDQMEDINRFIAGYFDKVENLNLTVVRLYGAKMRDAGQAFSLNYPNEILSDPAHAVAGALSKAPGQMDVLIKTKLPSPPIAMTGRNMVFFASAVLLAALLSYTTMLKADIGRYKHELSRLSHRAEHMKRIYATAKKLESSKLELEQERDFYLKITKRRAPWHLIMYDLGDLTPRNLWFERFNAAKNTVMIAGKATSPEDVAALSLNLSNSSRYFEDAQVMGMRDYKESDKTYTEFQLTAQLKSPLAKPKEEVVASEAKPAAAPSTKAVAAKSVAQPTTTAAQKAKISHESSAKQSATTSTQLASKQVHTAATTVTSKATKATAVKAAHKAYHSAF